MVSDQAVSKVLQDQLEAASTNEIEACEEYFRRVKADHPDATYEKSTSAYILGELARLKLVIRLLADPNKGKEIATEALTRSILGG